MKLFSNSSKELEKFKIFLEHEDHDFYPPLSDREKIEEYLQEMIQGKIVYFEDEKIFAAICYFDNYEKYNSAYIKFIAVLPEYRHQHYGMQLMERALQELKGKLITITTWSTDKPALELYQHIGFKIVKVLKNDRGNNVDTIVLEKIN